MRIILVAVATLATGLIVGVGLGWLSWLVMVIGLVVLVLGLAVGVALGGMLVATDTLGQARWSLRLVALVAVLVGWGAMQVVEDRHFVQGHVEAEIARRWASAPEIRAAYKDVSDPGLDALVRAATEARLAAEVGGDSLLDRWWYRAQSGVRLAGPWNGSRGLPVGAIGAALWSVAEILLATALALTVVRRLRRRVAS